MNDRIGSFARRYALELSIVGLACIVLIVGVIMTQANHTPAAPSAAVAPPGADSAAGGGGKALPGKTAYSLDVVRSGSQSISAAGKEHVQVSIGRGNSMLLAGWAIDLPGGKPAGGISAQVDGGKDLPGSYGAERADVASALKNDAFGHSAFVIVVPASELPPGSHTISLKILNAARSGYYFVSDPLDVSVN